MQKILILLMVFSSLCLGVEKRAPWEEVLSQRDYALSHLKNTNNKQKQKTFQSKLAQEEEKMFHLLCEKYEIKMNENLILKFIPKHLQKAIKDSFHEYVEKMKQQDQVDVVSHFFDITLHQFVDINIQEYEIEKTKDAQSVILSYQEYKNTMNNKKLKTISNYPDLIEMVKDSFLKTFFHQKTNKNVFQTLITACKASLENVQQDQLIFEKLGLLATNIHEEAQKLSGQLTIDLAGKVFDRFKKSIQNAPYEKLQSWFESSIDPKEIFPVEENQISEKPKVNYFSAQAEKLIEAQLVIDKMFLLNVEAFLDNFIHLRDSAPSFLKTDCAQQLEELNTDIQMLQNFQLQFQKRIKLLKKLSSQAKKQQNVLLDFDRFAFGFLAHKIKSDPKIKEYIDQAIEKICQYFEFNPDLFKE